MNDKGYSDDYGSLDPRSREYGQAKAARREMIASLADRGTGSYKGNGSVSKSARRGAPKAKKVTA